MPLLNEDINKQIREIFAVMKAPVKLVLFIQDEDGQELKSCPACDDTRQLIEEVSDLSDKIEIKVYDLKKDTETAVKYGITKVPAIAFLGGDDEKDWGIRMYGIPAGYEFSSLIEGILSASSRQPELNAKTVMALKQLDRPVHIQVYVTPT
jgi:glutaredoxin-like protein